MHENKYYFCYECGAEMAKADEEVLVCTKCGHSVDIEDYVAEEEIYDAIFGSRDIYVEDYEGGDNEEFPGEKHEDISSESSE